MTKTRNEPVIRGSTIGVPAKATRRMRSRHAYPGKAADRARPSVPLALKKHPPWVDRDT
jgi:hypothetical protein